MSRMIDTDVIMKRQLSMIYYQVRETSQALLHTTFLTSSPVQNKALNIQLPLCEYCGCLGAVKAE